MNCLDCDSPYHRRCRGGLLNAVPAAQPHSPAWRALDTLRLLQQHARRHPQPVRCDACRTSHPDDAAVRIAVRRLRGNQLT